MVRAGNRRAPWTTREVTLLCKGYRELGPELIQALRPLRTVRAIRAKANSLGLRVSVETTRRHQSAVQRNTTRRVPDRGPSGRFLLDEDGPDPTPNEIKQRAADIRRSRSIT